MTEEQKMWLVLGLISALLAAAVLSIAIRRGGALKRRGIQDEYLSRAAPQTIGCHVKVVDRRCFVKRTGSKIPIITRCFLVVFEDDHGQTLEIEVGEGLYDGFEIGQIGELTLTNGSVTSYVLDEEGN